MWVLYGQGTNGINVPLMVFNSKNDALGYLSGIPEIEPLMKEAKEHRGIWFLSIDFEELENELGEEVLEKFFISHYFGCGGCYGLSIEEKDMGVPLFVWNFD